MYTSSFHTTVRGSSQVVARLRKFPPQARTAVDKALKLSAKELRDTAQAASPVETGALRESIRIINPRALIYIVAAGDETPKARAVEFGRAGVSAQPYLLPAQRILVDKQRRRISRSMNRAVRLANGR